MPLDYSKRGPEPLVTQTPPDPIRDALSAPNFFEEQRDRALREKARYTKNALSRALHKKQIEKLDSKLDFAERSIKAIKESKTDASSIEDDGPEL